MSDGNPWEDVPPPEDARVRKPRWDELLLRDSPPQVLRCEEEVLGALLLDPGALDEVEGKIHPEDFYKASHAITYRAIEDLHRRGQSTDVTTVAAQMESRGELERVGGRTFLAGLLDTVATTVHVKHHAKMVADRARARKIIHESIRAIQAAQRVGGVDGSRADEVAAQFGQRIAALGQANGFGLAEGMWEGASVTGGQNVAPSWIVEPFFAREDVVVVQADSGVGKTWFLLCMMLHAVCGKEFLGRFMCTPTRWLYCDFDMHPDGHIVKHRLRRLSRGMDLKFAEDWWVLTRKHLPGAINLTTGEGLGVLEGTIRKKKVDVVVLEVFGALHGAKNENDSAQMEPVMSRLRDFAAKNHVAVILPHHTRKRQMGLEDDPASSGRGSTTIKNRADCTIDLRHKKLGNGEKSVVVSHVKARYLKQLPDFCIKIEDDSLLEATMVKYEGEDMTVSATTSKFETWLTDEIWPKIVDSGLSEVPMKDILQSAVEDGICSARSARLYINSMEKRRLIKGWFVRLAGHRERVKMIQLADMARGGKTSGMTDVDVG